MHLMEVCSSLLHFACLLWSTVLHILVLLYIFVQKHKQASAGVTVAFAANQDHVRGTWKQDRQRCMVAYSYGVLYNLMKNFECRCQGFEQSVGLGHTERCHHFLFCCEATGY